VIARPFEGSPGAFRRTDGRRDLALAPPGASYLLELQADGVEVHAVGKVGDLFAGVGIDRRYPGADNARALASTEALLAGPERGLLFVNLIETDQVYGHRKDPLGFARALAEIDGRLAGMLASLGEQDLLIVTADHGVDPAHPGTDHTREYAPLLALTGGMLADTAAAGAGGGVRQGQRAGTGRLHDGLLADVGATVLRWLTGRESEELPGRALAP
jgi:phosphopentomutase